MKVTVEQRDKAKELPFPKLMISENNGKIVYFEEEGGGLLIHNPHDSDDVGYITDWDMKHFKDFKGKITLEQ